MYWLKICKAWVRSQLRWAWNWLKLKVTSSNVLRIIIHWLSARRDVGLTQGSLIPKEHSHIMEARSGQNHDHTIATQVNFNSTVANIMDLLCIFVIIIIFSNMSYFRFWHYTNTFFIHTTSYFPVVLRIIFLMYIENYFFFGPRIIFRGITNLFFWPTMLCGPCSWRGLVRVFPRYDYVRQVDHIRSYWNPKRKLGVATHFSEITALQSLKRHFLEKW